MPYNFSVTKVLNSLTPTQSNRMAAKRKGKSGMFKRSSSSKKAKRYTSYKSSSGNSGYVDLAPANYPQISTGTVTLLNTVAQGAGQKQRVGKRITLKSLQFRGKSKAQANNTISHSAFCIVYDNRPTGTLPTVTEVFETDDPESMNKDDNSQRFTILKRVERAFVGGSTLGQNGLTAKTSFVESFFLDLKMRPQVFKSLGTGAIGDIDEGALYLVQMGSAPTTYGSELEGSFRLRYIDVKG